MEPFYEPDADPVPDPLNEAASEYFGINYLFPYQRLVISNILETDEKLRDLNAAGPWDNDDVADFPSRQIVILPTGAGKSLCFMLPSVLLDGPTLVIFPLLSLIADQLRRCESAGIGAACLTGGQSQSERKSVFQGIKSGKIKIVLTNPETALSPQVLPKLKDSAFMHLVFDEVHTVSEWGDTFRSAYLESRRIYTEAQIPIVTAFTATASETVLQRVIEVLFPDDSPRIVSANPDRPNIAYTVLPTYSKINSLQNLLGQPRQEAAVPGAERPALVFCSTRKTAEKTALQLRLRLGGENIFFYHAGLDKHEKAKIEKWFFGSEDGILCATCAYGMGIDKSNIRTVIHYNLSPSVEAYLQESGRAGRDRNPAEAILLLSPSDRLTGNSKDLADAAYSRYAALLGFAENTSRCRRESLMRLLGAEPETCFGCDVCRNTVRHQAGWHNEMTELIKKRRRILNTSGAAKMAAAIHAGLTRKDAAEVLDELLAEGCIRKIRRGPWKGRLTL